MLRPATCPLDRFHHQSRRREDADCGVELVVHDVAVEEAVGVGLWHPASFTEGHQDAVSVSVSRRLSGGIEVPQSLLTVIPYCDIGRVVAWVDDSRPVEKRIQR